MNTRIPPTGTYKTFASINRASYQPTFTVTVSYSDYDSKTWYLKEGYTFNVNVPKYVTVNSIRSTNTNVATVNSEGAVTTVGPGYAEIIVNYVNDQGKDVDLVLQKIKVILEDGVYFIQNAGPYSLLSVQNNLIKNGQNVVTAGTHLDIKLTFTSSLTIDQLSKMWRIRYNRHSDVYIISSMLDNTYKLSCSGDLVSQNAEYNAELMWTDDGLYHNDMIWNIEKKGYYYTITNANGRILALSADSGSSSTGNVVLDDSDVNQSRQKWLFSRVQSFPSGLVIYDTRTGRSNQNISTKNIALGQEYNLLDFEYAISYHSLYHNYLPSLYWSVAQSSLANIDATSGVVQGKSVSSTTVKVNVSDTPGGSAKGYYYVKVVDIPNGNYYLENAGSGFHMDVEGPSFADGTPLQHWAPHGESQSRFYLEKQSNGYYTIKNEYTKKYVGVENNSYANRSLIKQYSSGSMTGTQWKITVSSSGNYVFTPKCGESTSIAMSALDGSTTSGADLLCYTYYNNTTYYDEWKLEKFNFTFYGIPDSEPPKPSYDPHDHSGALSDIKDKLTDSTNVNRYTFVTEKYYSIWDPEVCVNDLTKSKIFVSRSHGTGDNENSTAYSFIVLNDKYENNRYYSEAIYLGSSSESYSGRMINDNDDFSNLDIAVFAGCKTGYGGDDASNLASVVVEQGARVAIGFNVSIYCGDADDWTKKLFNYLLDGYTIEEAVTLACAPNDPNLDDDPNNDIVYNQEEAYSPIYRSMVVIVGDSDYRPF